MRGDLLPGSVVAVLVLIASSCPAASGGTPVDRTRYGQSSLRLEARAATPFPPVLQDDAARRTIERGLARVGVQARWIQMVSNDGAPLISNPYLPCEDGENTAENQATLKQWVTDIHEAGLPAMSWYNLNACRSAWAQHPEWREVSLLPWGPNGPKNISCCFMTGYGDALINYCIYAIETLGLDGIWFDGSVWSPIWTRPLPLTCACASCKTAFRRDTGLEIPGTPDWADPVFRRWVQWRYLQFGTFIGRLAARIREKHPDAAIVINHYHRPGIPWHSALPIDLYEADIITGSEAHAPDTVDLTMRLCRAYNRPQAEVWRVFDLLDTPESDADRLLRHALMCYVAGGQPSFGGDCTQAALAPTAALMTPVMDAIRPWVGGPSLRYAALHVSQQTETFHFARGGTTDSPSELYWSALSTWTAALNDEHLPPDYVFDADLALARLQGYQLLLLPLSQALTDAQAQTALQFARQGGTVLLGLGAGELDAEGEPRQANPFTATLGVDFGGAPSPDGLDPHLVVLRESHGDKVLTSRGMWVPMTLTPDVWTILWQGHTEEGDEACVAKRKLGRGQVVVLNVDATVAVNSTPVAGGSTQLEVAAAAAAQGTYGLMFVDGPDAPHSFYPDLENRFPAFGLPEYTGGELSCDVKMGEGAAAYLQLRSTCGAILGPDVGFGTDGRIRCGERVLGSFEPDRWMHMQLRYRFAQEGKPSRYDVTISTPDTPEITGTFDAPSPEFCRTDWLVVYGPGEKPGVFYVDNLELARITATGERHVALRHDFEDGPDMFQGSTGLARVLARMLKSMAPSPVEVVAPTAVRIGLFETDGGQVLVHLHNRQGTLRDWQQDRGPGTTLHGTIPVGRARLLPGERPLPLVRDGERWTIQIPAVGLYQVIALDPPAAQP